MRDVCNLSLKLPAALPFDRYKFSQVFGPETRQVDLYNSTAEPLVKGLFEGQNGVCCPLLLLSFTIALVPLDVAAATPASAEWLLVHGCGHEMWLVHGVHLSCLVGTHVYSVQV
jgi:hypothetical protein